LSSATRSPRALRNLPVVSFHISKKQNHEEQFCVIASHWVDAKRRPMTGSAKQSSVTRYGWLDCFVAYTPRNDSFGFLSHIKNKAGDDEHCRHRQRLRKRFRGRPLGGFLHAFLPRLGRESSLPAKAA
jgi:hypothetical protein